MFPPPPRSTLFPYTTLFRSSRCSALVEINADDPLTVRLPSPSPSVPPFQAKLFTRSEEHTSELQSHVNIVCRLQLAKKKSVPASTSRSEPNEVPEPVLMVTL